MKILKSLFPLRISAIFFCSALLGFLAILHYRSLQSAINYREQGEVLALIVSREVTESAELRKQVAVLEETRNKLKEAVSSSSDAETTIKETIKEYQIFSGVSKVSGPGVVINIKRRLATSELVDLVNLLRGLGAEAISINGERIAIRTPLDGAYFGEQLKIEVIGSPTVLGEGLKKKGGILEQINKDGEVATVESVKTLTLPPVRSSQFYLGSPQEL